MKEKSKWFSGVTDIVPFALGNEIKDHFQNELSNRKITTKNLPDFLSAIEEAISIYHASRKLQEKCSPGDIRKNLKVAKKQAIKLYNLMANLDSASKQLIGDYGENDFAYQQAQLLEILSAIDSASKIAARFPRADDPAKIFLAYKTAEAIKQHLNRSPTSTKEGLYSAVLSITLAAATGKEVKDVNDLARRGLHAFRYKTDPLII